MSTSSEHRSLAPGARTHRDLMLHARALADEWRESEALDICAAAVETYPTSAAAWHNMAAMEQRLGHFEQATQSARRAMELGSDNGQTWTVLARALQGLGAVEDAWNAYLEASEREPTLGEVHRDLAQLIWMHTADVELATAPLRRAVADYPDEPALVAQLAKALSYGGRRDEAYRLLLEAIGHRSTVSAILEISAADMARGLHDHRAALAHGEYAVGAAPDNPAAILALTDSLTSLALLTPAASLVERLHRKLPHAQQITARLCTLWRLQGDPRYQRFQDYGAFVRTYDISCPPGWEDRDAFLSELANGLQTSHTMRAHPFDQSVRNGTQTYSNLYRSQSPVIRAFFNTAEAKAAEFISALGHGEDPFTSRNTGAARIIDSWSVRQSKGGKHVNHVHQNGWISSVFYVQLPRASAAGSGQGWLKFGEPALETQPPLAYDYLVRPVVGRLVLFPSYFWHGTTEVTQTEGTRLTLAFDMAPYRP